jgi:hypothetical protein
MQVFFIKNYDKEMINLNKSMFLNDFSHKNSGKRYQLTLNSMIIYLDPDVYC